MPRFSILIPAYNAAKTLRRALDSVAAQQYPDWECLCCDDGSQDDTASIITKYAARDRRFQLLRHKRNRGILCNRNTLARRASGAYVVWLDNDDEIAPEFLATAAQLLDAESWDIIDFPFRYVDCSQGNLQEIAPDWPFFRVREENLVNFFFTRKRQAWFMWGKVIRTEVMQSALPPEEQLAGVSLDDVFFCIPLYYGAKSYLAPDTRPMYRHYTGGTWNLLQRSSTLKQFQDLCDMRSLEFEYNAVFLRRHGFGDRYDRVLLEACDLNELYDVLIGIESPEERRAALTFLRQRFHSDVLFIPRTPEVRSFQQSRLHTR